MSKGVTVGEFILDLVVDAGKGELTVNGLIASMGQLEVASVGEIAILFELAQKLASLAEHAIATSLGIEHVTSSTGMNTKALQQWTSAAQYVNISGETMANTLASISHNLAMGKFSGDYGGLKNLSVLLSRAHLSLQDFKADHPEELLKSIRDSSFFQGLSPSQQYTVLSGSGLQELLELLQKTRISDQELKRVMSEAPVMSDAEIKHYDYIFRRMTEIKQLSLSIGELILGWTSTAFLNWFDKVGGAMKEIDTWLAAKGKNTEDDSLMGKLGQLDPKVAINQLYAGLGTALVAPLGIGTLGNILPVPEQIFADPDARKPTTQITKIAPVIHINGSNKSTPELEALVRKALEGVFDPAASQTNTGPH